MLDSFTNLSNLSRTGTLGNTGGAFTASTVSLLFCSNRIAFNCGAHVVVGFESEFTGCLRY